MFAWLKLFFDFLDRVFQYWANNQPKREEQKQDEKIDEFRRAVGVGDPDAISRMLDDENKNRLPSGERKGPQAPKG